MGITPCTQNGEQLTERLACRSGVRKKFLRTVRRTRQLRLISTYPSLSSMTSMETGASIARQLFSGALRFPGLPIAKSRCKRCYQSKTACGPSSFLWSVERRCSNIGWRSFRMKAAGSRVRPSVRYVAQRSRHSTWRPYHFR